MKKVLDHLQCTQDDIAPIVLMPSNPAKADRIAGFLDNAKNVGRYREFVSWTGTYNTIPVSVISTGVGCPSTAIAVEEAILGGAQILIRVGTCGGSWRDDIPCGSLILPTACVREEGTTSEYVPTTFPAVADFSVMSALARVASTMDIQVFTGINRTHDAYYGSGISRERWTHSFESCDVPLPTQPILSSEMECSALYLLAALRGVKAGAVLSVNADPEALCVQKQSNVIPAMKSNKVTADYAEEYSIELVLQSLPDLKMLIE